MLTGTRLGAYEIVGSLGAGGMGEVYRATDTKLGRAVAIKILPDAFAADGDRVPRFEREAKLLASLNHPHIAALFGMEQAEGRHFIIMELVEGETLADRLRDGPLTIDETLGFAAQIADALEAAHEQGIVHRDLKPANVKITPGGRVKVLDFGLAKTVEPGAAAHSVSQSPTFSVHATQAGTIMGTAAYMSPEQAKGLPADRRSDVFSFGVVLYEMLTGRQPFHGETAAEVMASVMIHDADLAALPSTIPPRLREIITRCLEKQPRQRWQAMGDLRVELEALRAAPLPSAPSAATAIPAPARASLWKHVAPIVAAVVLTAAGTALVVNRWRPSPARGVVRFSIPAHDIRLISASLAVAPGGAAIAYVSVTSNQAQLLVRRVQDFEAKPIEAARAQLITSPAFSDGGASLAFFADRQIRRVDLRGGPAVTICTVPGQVRGLSWRGSRLLFAVENAIYRVADSGGTPEVVAQFNEGELAGLPQAIDDDGTLLYNLASGRELATATRQVILQTRSGKRTVVADNAVNPFYVEPGRVLFMREGTLMAIRVDLRTGEVLAGPVPLVEGITRLLSMAPVFHVAVSTDGALAYVPGAIGNVSRSRLALVEQNGTIEFLNMPLHFYGHPRLSPDGSRLAVESDDGKETALWVGPVTGNTPLRRLTFEGRNTAPVWTNDGQYLAFQSERGGDRGVYMQRADGSAPAVRLTRAEPDSQHIPESWSPDDRLLTMRVSAGRFTSIWLAARDGTAPKPLVQVENRSAYASAFSPDGRWLAYGSNEIGGGVFVWVQPFPPTGVKYQLTTENTSTPVWSKDGKQLYFAFTNRIFRADVQSTGGMSLGPATAFETAGSVPSTPPTRHFDVTPDGKRFLVVLPEGVDGFRRTSINVVLNWAEELDAKLPK
jgi:serine/threonine-protein kinase